MPQTVHDHLQSGPNRELTELYASLAIKSFAVGLIGIFEPIYLYFAFGESLWKVFVFVGAVVTIMGVFSPFGAKLASKIGVKHAMLASVVPLFLYYIGLWQIEALGSWVVVLILLAALYKVLFWPAFHIDFTRFATQGRRGRELGIRGAVGSLFGAIAPGVGGLIIVSFGFSVLFTFVLILLLISAGVLFLTRDIEDTYEDSFEKTFTLLRKKKYRNKVVAFAFEGLEANMHLVLWPLFLFFLAIDFKVMGFVVSGAMLIATFFWIFLGRVVDRKGADRALKLGAVLNAFTWPIKMFVISPMSAFLVHTLHLMTRATEMLPQGVLFYRWAAEKPSERDRRVILREMSINIARGLMFFVLAAIFYYVEPLGIRYTFLVAAISAIGMLMMLKDKPQST